MTLEERIRNEKFSKAKNDGERESLLLMILRIDNLIRKQLPNMLHRHVSRLVLNLKHERLSLFSKNLNGDNAVMAGCCCRPFTRQKFGEFGFLNVSQLKIRVDIARN